MGSREDEIHKLYERSKDQANQIENGRQEWLKHEQVISGLEIECGAHRDKIAIQTQEIA